MGPFLGPFAAALLAALAAGLSLGIVRLSRRSLEWWRRRNAPAVLPGALEAMADVPAFVPLPEFPGVNGAIACAAFSALLLGAAALLLTSSPDATLPPIAAHPFDAARLVPRALTYFAFGGAVLAGALAIALASSLLERAMARAASLLSARVRQLRALHVDAPGSPALSMADLKAGASGWWTGAGRVNEPFGVGLGYVALFVTPVAALALVARAAFATPAPGWVSLFASLFLAVPLAYAAAAERSQRDLGARHRRRAALRQLLAAPAWAFALLEIAEPATGHLLAGAPHAAAWLALACAALLGLPGSTTGRGLLELPLGGDEAEPSPAVRAISGLAHHAWLGAWAAFLALAFAPRAGLLAGALLALGGLLAARGLLAGFARERAGVILLVLAWGFALLDAGVRSFRGSL